MTHRTCVIYDRLRSARAAERSLRRSELGEHLENVVVHTHDLGDGKLSWGQTRPREGAVWGGITMAAFGATLAAIPVAIGVVTEFDGWLVILMGAIFGGAFGALAGAIVGTTEPDRQLAAIEPLLERGRAALIAELDSAEQAREAERLLLGKRGALRTG
jgi:hypothetical protein